VSRGCSRAVRVPGAGGELGAGLVAVGRNVEGTAWVSSSVRDEKSRAPALAPRARSASGALPLGVGTLSAGDEARLNRPRG
jgi:hypothetical protein